jgi:tetratricopeptide (TPR) repeat protein
LREPFWHSGSHFRFQRLFAAILFLVFAASSRAVAQPDPNGPLPADYKELVRLYVTGEGAQALAELARWDAPQLKRRIEAVHHAVVRIRSSPTARDRIEFARFPLKAAILMHADREIEEQWSRPVSEQPARCGTGLNSNMIDELASVLILVDPDAGFFLKQFYLGMARYAFWAHCLAESQQWARAGLKLYPRDAPLFLAAGVASDQTAFFTSPPAPSSFGLAPRDLARRDDISSRIRFLREAARKAYQEALSADPNLAEARLRLGRVQWYLGQVKEARVCFETVLAKAGPHDVHYLAHLFFGRLLEDEGELEKAEEHYRNAWSMQPSSEIAAVAVSHARFLRGDLDSARTILKDGLEAVQERNAFDPLLPYLVLQAPQGEALLDELRRSVLR